MIKRDFNQMRQEIRVKLNEFQKFLRKSGSDLLISLKNKDAIEFTKFQELSKTLECLMEKNYKIDRKIE